MTIVDAYINTLALEKATIYFEWGNEPRGMVSTGFYDEHDVFKSTGFAGKNWAENRLINECPYS